MKTSHDRESTKLSSILEQNFETKGHRRFNHRMQQLPEKRDKKPVPVQGIQVFSSAFC